MSPGTIAAIFPREGAVMISAGGGFFRTMRDCAGRGGLGKNLGRNSGPKTNAEVR